MDPYILYPQLEYEVCCGRISTLKLVDFWLRQLVELLHCHSHFISGWTHHRVNKVFPGFSLLREQDISSPIFAEGFRGVDVKPPSVHWQSAHGRDAVSPIWLPQPIHLQGKPFLLPEYFATNRTNVHCNLLQKWYYRGNQKKQRVPRRTTNGCLNAGVVSAIKKSYLHLKFV